MITIGDENLTHFRGRLTSSFEGMNRCIVSMRKVLFVTVIVSLSVCQNCNVRALSSSRQTFNSPRPTSFHAIPRYKYPQRLVAFDENSDPRKQAATAKNGIQNSENALLASRKSFISTLVLLSGASLAPHLTPRAHAATNKETRTSLAVLLAEIKEARAQLDPIPSLIKAEKWDSVRAILITPPLSDCWSKTAKALLKDYAGALGDEASLAINDDAEFNALEFKEEALDHLRFLDMAVYNNIFNPIKTEGESGASKELVRSYYDDPMREYKASLKAMDGLISLVKSG